MRIPEPNVHSFTLPRKSFNERDHQDPYNTGAEFRGKLHNTKIVFATYLLCQIHPAKVDGSKFPTPTTCIPCSQGHSWVRVGKRKVKTTLIAKKKTGSWGHNVHSNSRFFVPFPPYTLCFIIAQYPILRQGKVACLMSKTFLRQRLIHLF